MSFWTALTFEYPSCPYTLRIIVKKMNPPSAFRSVRWQVNSETATFTFCCPPPSRNPRLPPELTDRVIDHLHDDPTSLAACSLVCSAWLPAARFHHFREVTVVCDNVHAFHELIRHPSSKVGSYVQTLKAECQSNTWNSRRCPDGPCFLQDPWTLSLVLASIHRLPALRELRLRGIPAYVIPRPLPTVTCLDIDGPPPSDWAISRWLLLLPNLRTLLAYFSSPGVLYENHDADPARMSDVLTRQSEGGVSMRQMRVWLPNLSPSTRIVVEGLFPTKALSNLRAFSFACSFNQPGIVKGLQQRLGPSLRVLELMCDDVFASGGQSSAWLLFTS